MDIQAITLFPQLVESVVAAGVTGRAVQRSLLQLSCINPRDFAENRHRSVDDRPYGGGTGMVMQVEPLRGAIHHARDRAPQSPVVFFSPQGEVLRQDIVAELARLPGVILVCGRYEGVDERLIEMEVDRELSLGDYVISGGELAAMVVIDAIARLLPGALGHEESAAQDSFSNGLLDCPHYTRPSVYEGRAVPDVLLSGDHRQIARWRQVEILRRTRERRPDLLRAAQLTPEQRELLASIERESGVAE